ncbi:hypothetical protein CYY_003263 [Polysphondylium violaceum]|uniref:SIAH-type domain-containing protein n=1 Tax=Polysphondylium violaceum TaxID=133409 RepID=A0A8J4V8V3_9MYCE|nr:hypothetical protein CYY_003263 [Polysphondylium violaceum]
MITNNNSNNSNSNSNNNNSKLNNKGLILIDNSLVECGVCYSTQFSKSYSCDFCDFWTCESCLPSSIGKQCPKCKRPWPKIPRRNYIIERLIEEAQQPCKHFSDGCNQIFSVKDGETKKKNHEEVCLYRKIPCPLNKILGCQLETLVAPEEMEKHFENHHRLDSVYLHDQERETEFFRMTMMSPLPKGTETSCLLLKQEEHTIVFVSTGEGVFRSFLFLFVTPPPKRYQIRVYGTNSVIKINDKPQIWADICDTLPLVSFTISQQQYLKWSHANTSKSFCILLKVADEEEDEDDDDEDEEDDEDDEEDDEDEDEDNDDKDSNDDDEGGSKQRFLKKLKVK